MKNSSISLRVNKNKKQSVKNTKTRFGLEKYTFRIIFLFLAILLVFLPFLTTFNEFLTRIVSNLRWYTAIEKNIVPYEVKMVVAVLKTLGIKATGSIDTVYLFREGQEVFRAMIIWSCIGWESMILYIITLFVGLQGSYRISSKIECVVIGFLGTFLVNILRISSVFVVGYFFGELPVLVYHNYIGTIMIIIWLLLFWWFSYAYVLTPKERENTTNKTLINTNK